MDKFSPQPSVNFIVVCMTALVDCSGIFHRKKERDNMFFFLSYSHITCFGLLDGTRINLNFPLEQREGNFAAVLNVGSDNLFKFMEKILAQLQPSACHNYLFKFLSRLCAFQH